MRVEDGLSWNQVDVFLEVSQRILFFFFIIDKNYVFKVLLGDDSIHIYIINDYHNQEY